MSNDAATCLECGSALARQVMDGLCPKCVALAMMGPVLDYDSGVFVMPPNDVKAAIQRPLNTASETAEPAAD